MNFWIYETDFYETEHRAHLQNISRTCWLLNMLEKNSNLPLSEDTFDDEPVELKERMRVHVPIYKKLRSAMKEGYEGWSLQQVFDYAMAREFGEPCPEAMEYLDELLDSDPNFYDSYDPD